MLHDLALDERRDRIAVSDLLAVLGDRALDGLATAAVSAVLVSGVVFAMVKSAVYFITEVLR